MRRSQYSEEQIIGLLKQAELGNPIDELGRWPQIMPIHPETTTEAGSRNDDPNQKKPNKLAEREGFEPSVPVTQYARLAISRQSANTGTLARLLETENPCGSAICRIRVVREMSRRVSPDLIQTGKFTPPCPHPNGSKAWEASPNQNAASVQGNFFGNPQNGWVS